jgi:hypothetical protein
MVYNILSILCYITSPLFQEYLKKRWTWRACGQTPLELLIDRVYKTSPSVPNATTSPHFLGFSIKDNPSRPDISAYILSLVDRLATISKTLKFEEKML